MIDEEEYRLIKDLSTAKKTYRSHFDALRDAKGRSCHLVSAVDCVLYQHVSVQHRKGTCCVRGAAGAVAQASEELDHKRADVLEAFETWWAANAPAEAKGGEQTFRVCVCVSVCLCVGTLLAHGGIGEPRERRCFSCRDTP